MKRRGLFIAVIASVLLIAGLVIFLLNRPESEPVNASRRDGKVVDGLLGGDEDLLAVSGESIDETAENNNMNAEKAKERSDEDSALFSSIMEAEATVPTSAEVESVEVLVLPEAVNIGEGDKDAFYNNEEFAEVVPVDASSFEALEIPKSYDSRNVDGKSYITPVKDQGYTYLCWTYVAMGAIESDILRHNETLTPSDINLSEKHISYYNMHKAEGSYGGYLDGDYREFVNADYEAGAWIFDHDTNYIATGGVNDYCISILTAWKGPVIEEGIDSFASIYGKKHVFEDNSEKPSSPYACDYHVQDIIEIKSDLANNQLVKQMIMEHGCVSAGVCAEDAFWGSSKKNLYSDFKGKEIPTADHEVLIVGWDDDYPASNFRTTPPGDGAWICKNSWGQNSGNNGFFYLSYYDQTTANNNVAAYSVAEKEDEDWYDNNYQAAGFITYMTSTLEDAENYVTALSESKNQYGMLYTAQSDEGLKAVGLMALETYQQYDFEVYVNPEVETKETSDEEIKKEKVLSLKKLGKPSATFKGAAISGGYHTFKLPEDVKLAAGDEFFVLVKPTTSGRLVFENAVEGISKPNYDEWHNLTGNVHNHYEASGCSFYISDDGTSFVSQVDKDFFVKAYTDTE